MGDKDRKVEGTHMGLLDADARQRRVAKNARNRSRRGLARRPAGTQRRPPKTSSTRRA